VHRTGSALVGNSTRDDVRRSVRWHAVACSERGCQLSEQTTHTPGPWAWFGNANHGYYLATVHSGRRYVMDFVRKGTNNAQPRFQPGGKYGPGMVKADDLCEFEVGNEGVIGLKAGKADGSVYRYDVTGFDCADARLIAAAPEMFDALSATLGYLSEHADEKSNELWAKVAAAVRKAKGVTL